MNPYAKLDSVSLETSSSAEINNEAGFIWAIRDEFIFIYYDANKNTNMLMNQLYTILVHINKYSGYIQLLEWTPIGGYNSEDFVCKHDYTPSFYNHIIDKSKFHNIHAGRLDGCSKTTILWERRGDQFKLDNRWQILKYNYLIKIHEAPTNTDRPCQIARKKSENVKSREWLIPVASYLFSYFDNLF